MVVQFRRLLKNRIGLLGISGLAVIIILAVGFQPVEDQLGSLASNFSGTFDPFSNAPSELLSKLSLAPNLFSECEIINKSWLVEKDGTKRIFGQKSINAIPFIQYSLISTQLDREIKDFVFEIGATCKITATGPGWDSLKPIRVDSGTILLEIYALKPDGTQSKVYAKTYPISGVGKDLDNYVVLSTITIPATDIESQLPKQTDSYKSSIKIKPLTTMKIYFAGDSPKNKWTVGGQSETNLSVTVAGQGCAPLQCLIINREIKLTVDRPHENIATLSDRRVTFTVILPEWDSVQGSPKYSVKDSQGLYIIRDSPLILTRTDGVSGVFTKSILLPEKIGTYDIIVTQDGRNAASATIKMIKPVTTITCPEGTVLQNGDCKAPPQPCPDGYILVENECLRKGGGDNTGREQPQQSEVFVLLQELFTRLLLGDFAGLQDPKFFGFYVSFGILLFIIIIASALRRS